MRIIAFIAAVLFSTAAWAAPDKSDRPDGDGGHASQVCLETDAIYGYDPAKGRNRTLAEYEAEFGPRGKDVFCDGEKKS